MQNFILCLNINNRRSKLRLNRAKASYRTPEHRIAATDRQIDRLVYDLYGLTEEEVGIVESGGR